MSLSQQTIAIVKATAAPIIVNGEEITTRMYEILFTKHPEPKELFKDADPDQHKKLAGAVAAYAANIDNLDTLSTAIENMAQKHVKTMVKPEYYPLVGVSLLHAVKDVLGDAATDVVIEAWKEAYFSWQTSLLLVKKRSTQPNHFLPLCFCIRGHHLCQLK